MLNPFFLCVSNCLFLVEFVTKQQLMAIGTSIEGANRVDIAIVSIAQGEIFVDVYTC